MIRKKLELSARCKTSSGNTVFYLYSEFYSITRTFRRSIPDRVLILSCLSISVTLSWGRRSCVPWLKKRISCVPKVSVSCVSVASRVVTPTRGELRRTVNKEVSVAAKSVCFKCNNCVSSCRLHAYESHQNRRWAFKSPQNLKVFIRFYCTICYIQVREHIRNCLMTSTMHVVRNYVVKLWNCLIFNPYLKKYFATKLALVISNQFCRFAYVI